MQQNATQGRIPMTFGFRNVGPVRDAQLELGDFTIIAGRNNTGKTYLVYMLYGFLKMWRAWPDADRFLLRKTEADNFVNLQEITERLTRDGRASLPLSREECARQRKVVTQALTRDFSAQAAAQVYSSRPDDFEGASIEVVRDGADHADFAPVKSDLDEGSSLSIQYDGGHVVMTLDKGRRQVPLSELRFYIAHRYVLFLLEGVFPDPFILSAERFGISLFYRELDFTKSQLVDVLQKMGDDKNRDRLSPFLVIDRTTSRYALPIKDNIDYTRGIPDRRREKSEFHKHKLYDDIKDMMDGYYGVSGDEIRFISKARGSGRSFNIPLYLASSSARGLSDFYFFLRHVARKNHLLIIDEPESHLDTANQIQLARLLVRFVRAGLKVLITTHSDYLIKEVNNLVMLSRPFANRNALIKKLNYRTDDALDQESIRAYVAENNGLTRCKVDHFGIDMPVFDRTIDEINDVANELAARVAEEAEGVR